MKKIALTMPLIVTLLACSQEQDHQRLPTDPVPPDVPGQTSLWGMVVDESGGCIVDATATVVAGQALGQSVRQSTPCNAWDYGNGFVFNHLTSGGEMTIRVSAPGYLGDERTVVPSVRPQMAVLFTPPRIPSPSAEDMQE